LCTQGGSTIGLQTPTVPPYSSISIVVHSVPFHTPGALDSHGRKRPWGRTTLCEGVGVAGVCDSHAPAGWCPTHRTCAQIPRDLVARADDHRRPKDDGPPKSAPGRCHLSTFITNKRKVATQPYFKLDCRRSKPRNKNANRPPRVLRPQTSSLRPKHSPPISSHADCASFSFALNTSLCCNPPPPVPTSLRRPSRSDLPSGPAPPPRGAAAPRGDGKENRRGVPTPPFTVVTWGGGRHRLGPSC